MMKNRRKIGSTEMPIKITRKSGGRRSSSSGTQHFSSDSANEIGRAGIVGEEKNRLSLFLAALTKDSKKSVSVLVKGPHLQREKQSCPRGRRTPTAEWVVVRSSLTTKALAYGAESLSGKILYLYEYRGGRDAQLLTRVIAVRGHTSPRAHSQQRWGPENGGRASRG